METLSQNEFHPAYDENDRYMFIACSCLGNQHGILIETVPGDPDIPLEARDIGVQFFAIGNRKIGIITRLHMALDLLMGHDYHYEEVVLTVKGARRLEAGLREMIAAIERKCEENENRCERT